MAKPKKLPGHESIIKSLQEEWEKALKYSPSQGDRGCKNGLRIRSQIMSSLLNHLKRTIVPEKHVEELYEKLRELAQNMKLQLLIDPQDEKIFSKVIERLKTIDVSK